MPLTRIMDDDEDEKDSPYGRIPINEEDEQQQEEKGAPSDFGGRVIPNPNDIKPIEDTDIKPRTDQPVEGKMSIQNAPAKTPQGDISNPPKAELNPSSMQPIIAKEPSTEMKSLPGKKNLEMQGAKTEDQNQVPNQITPQDASAVDTKSIFQKQKEDAAKSGDLVKLGAAILGEKATAPTTTEQASSDVLAPKDMGTAGATHDQTEIDPKHAFKNKIAQYKAAYQQALDEFTPEGQKRAAGIKEAMLNFMRENPYGSAGNHPGVLGKIEHGLAAVGNVAGTAVAPAITAEIPGSRLNMTSQSDAAQRMGMAASEEELKSAQAATGKSGARFHYETITDASGNQHGVIVDMLNKTSEPIPGTEGNKQIDPAKVIKNQIAAAAKAGNQADVDKYQQALVDLDPNKANEFFHGQVIQALSDKGLIDSSTVSDPKKVKEAIDTALGQNLINKRQVAGYNTWSSEHPDAAGKVQINLTEGADAQRRAQENKVVGHDVLVPGPNGTFEQMPYAEAKDKGFTLDQMEPMNATQAKKDQDEMANAMDVKRTMVQYRDDIATLPLQDDDRAIYQNITKNDSKVAGELSGIIGDIPLVGPISEAINKRMQSFMLSNGYNNLSQNGQRIMADYWSAIISNFQDTKRRLGGVGRNPELILAEMHNIPLPYLKAAASLEVLDQRLDSLDTRNRLLNRVRGEHPNDIVSKTRGQQQTQAQPQGGTETQPAAQQKAAAPTTRFNKPVEKPAVNIPTEANHRFRIEPKGKPALYSNDGKAWYNKAGQQVK